MSGLCYKPTKSDPACDRTLSIGLDSVSSLPPPRSPILSPVPCMMHARGADGLDAARPDLEAFRRPTKMETPGSHRRQDSHAESRRLAVVRTSRRRPYPPPLVRAGEVGGEVISLCTQGKLIPPCSSNAYAGERMIGHRGRARAERETSGPGGRQTRRTPAARVQGSGWGSFRRRRISRIERLR